MSSFKTLLESFLNESENDAKRETITTHATLWNESTNSPTK